MNNHSAVVSAGTALNMELRFMWAECSGGCSGRKILTFRMWQLILSKPLYLICLCEPSPLGTFTCKSCRCVHQQAQHQQMQRLSGRSLGVSPLLCWHHCLSFPTRSLTALKAGFCCFRTVHCFYECLICSGENLAERCGVCFTSKFWNGLRSKIFSGRPMGAKLFSPAHPHPSHITYNPGGCSSGTVPRPFICSEHKSKPTGGKGEQEAPLASLLVTFSGISGPLARRCSPRFWEQITWHLLFSFGAFFFLCKGSSLVLEEKHKRRGTDSSTSSKNAEVHYLVREKSY